MKHAEISKLLKTGAAVFLAAAVGLAVASLSANEGKEQANPSTAARGDFVKGASVWAQTCQRCHNMRDPKDLDDAQWKAVVTHMRLRAGLTGRDARDVLSFLQQSNDE